MFKIKKIKFVNHNRLNLNQFNHRNPKIKVPLIQAHINSNNMDLLRDHDFRNPHSRFRLNHRKYSGFLSKLENFQVFCSESVPI